MLPRCVYPTSLTYALTVLKIYILYTPLKHVFLKHVLYMYNVSTVLWKGSEKLSNDFRWENSGSNIIFNFISGYLIRECTLDWL